MVALPKACHTHATCHLVPGGPVPSYQAPWHSLTLCDLAAIHQGLSGTQDLAHTGTRPMLYPGPVWGSTGLCSSSGLFQGRV